MVVALAFVVYGGCGIDALTASAQTSSQNELSAKRPELELGRTAEYDYDPPEPGTYKLPEIKPAADGPVVGLDGRPSTLHECFRDRITVLSFIYTRCADPSACPYATGVLYKIHSISEQDPLIAQNLRLITFSFDPEHDTPRTMEDYSRALRKTSGSEWRFLTTAGSEDLRPILIAYGQQVDRREDPNHPLGPYFHLLRVYLIDRHGVIRNVYSSGLLDPRLVITDIRTLLLEEGESRE
jgi:cytochrome oxidase Cu insertion factor (SCO1/SenC/PrrC family)